MQYKKGERVRHPAMDDWGLGEVLEDCTEKTVKVFFVGGGERHLSLAHIELARIPLEEAIDPVLDNLKSSKTSPGIRYQSLRESIAYFLQQFPGGFYGERFARQERDYKARAHEQAVELLPEVDFRACLKRYDYDEIVRRALKIVNATNLIFPNEKMALKDGLQLEGAKKTFSLALMELLYSKETFEQRLTGFAKILEEVDAAKWTTLTYFPFIFHPSDHIFIKPTITQHAADLCAFEINYRPQLNWLTYKQVLTFGQYLRDQLADLEPRDMIDVQSFMWCIVPGTYPSSRD